jgi:iron complex outermembrane recepter protein
LHAVDWDFKGLAANLGWIHAASHTQIAEYETHTPGYDLLNLDVSWLFPAGSLRKWELFLESQNLLDDDVRNSTSFLKGQAPQLGRNFTLGARAYF